jgi:RNA polymerase sigma-70 factor, ECF subfamily
MKRRYAMAVSRPLSIVRTPSDGGTEVMQPAEPLPRHLRVNSAGRVHLNVESGEGDRRRDFDKAEVVSRFRRGDSAAFEEILERYWRCTLLHAQYLARDGDAALDFTQEAFARLWKQRERWAPSGSIRVWLFRTVRNLVISEQRKWKVRHLWASRSGPDERRSPRTPLQDTEAGELRYAIARAVEQLSPRRREAFTLFHVQGLSYREVAAVMGVREQSVANYLRAALADLRESLAAHFPGLAAPTDAVPGETHPE